MHARTASSPTSTPPATEERQRPGALSVPDSQTYLGGVSKQTIYRLAAADQLRIVKIGRRSVIPVADLDAILGLGAETIGAVS